MQKGFKTAIIILSVVLIVSITGLTVSLIVNKSNVSKESKTDDESEQSLAHVHTIVTDAAVEATCTTDGLTEGKHCSVCGEVIVKQETVKATGHNYENGVCKNCGVKLYSEGITYSANANQNGYIVTGIGTCKDAEIIIPEKHNNLPVTKIGEKAFADLSDVTSITIPDSVTSIGRYAFHGCTGLTSVTIGNGVMGIGEWAFCGCTGLTSITIPDSVTNIGEWAFYYVANIIYDGTIENSLWRARAVNGYVENGIVYKDSTKAELSACPTTATGNITIPKGVTSIGEYAFWDCTEITSVTIPDSVTSIGECAFRGCTGLISITIPDSVTSIGDSAFYGCSGLTSIIIPDSVKSIGGGAFSGCSGLTKITLPFIGNMPNKTQNAHFGYIFGAYSYNQNKNDVPNSLKTVIITKATKIFEYTFYGCKGITSITIPDSATNIGGYAFYDCTGLTSITIPDSVTSIKGHAFYGCTGLTSITIPGSVTSIEEFAFYNCIGLTSITIPDSVTSIGGYAFSGCSGLTSITIPDSVTSIGEWAFFNCTGLTSITIPDSVMSIGRSAFSHCTGLTSITIPDSVMSIGRSAFSHCTNLTDIYCEATSQPSGWRSSWNSGCSATVHWGYTGE